MILLERNDFKGRIPNYISLFLALFEMIGYSGIVFSFPFLEYIMKTEMVFHREMCNQNGTETDFANDPMNTLCEKALEQYNLIFTLGSVIAKLGPLFFGVVQNKWGIFYSRLICGVCTTSGLLCFYFYDYTAYMLYPGIVLVAFPALTYLVTNISITKIFPAAISALLSCVFVGLFDSSTGLFLIFKLVNENYGYSLKKIMLVHLIGSTLIHIRTLLFMPHRFVPRDDKSARRFSVSENSVGAEIFRHRSTISSMIQKSLQMSGFDAEEADRIEKERRKQLQSKQVSEENEQPVMNSVKSPVFWCILCFFVVNDFRITTILGWIYPWIEWAFANVDNGGTKISNLLNVYGYLAFGGPLWAGIVGSVFTIATKATGSKLRGDFIGTVTLMSFSCLMIVVVSIQMCFQVVVSATSPTAMVFLVPVLRSAFFSFPFTCMVLFFPIRHVPILFGIINVPQIALFWINQPLFNVIMNGDDKNFLPVNAGLAALSGLSAISILIVFICGWRHVKDEEERKRKILFKTLTFQT